MTLKEYIDLVIQDIPANTTVEFYLGITAIHGEIEVNMNSLNRIKFKVKGMKQSTR